MIVPIIIKKIYFSVKPYERNDKGNIWAMYKDNNKNLTSIKKISIMSNLHTNFRLET